MSISPGRNHSSRKSIEAQGEHDTQHAEAAMNAHAEVDDVPLSQVFRRATSNELPTEHVNCGPNLLVFVPFIAPCVTVCCILIFLQAQTNFLMHVQAPACGTSMQAPSPIVCQIQAGGLTTHSKNCHACGRQHESAWRSEVDRMLSLLVTRVAGVEETMDNVVGGISNIMWELDVIGRYVRKNAAVQRSTNIVHMQATHVDVATSTPFEWQQCNNQTNIGDVVVDVATPSCPQKQSVPHPDEPLRGTAARPIPVDLENMSSRSGDNPTTRNGKKMHSRFACHACP